MSVTIHPTVPERERERATDLYVRALHLKIERILGSAPRSVAFLAPTLVPDRGIVAVSADGRVVGIAGFKADGRGLFAPSVQDFRRAYGWSGPVRAYALSLLERDEDEDSLLMDGLAVSASSRGLGIGTLLLDAIEDRARILGKSAVRLDVIDSNDRARR